MALALSCETDRPLSADQLSETGDALRVAAASSVAPIRMIFFIVNLLQLPLLFSMQESRDLDLTEIKKTSGDFVTTWISRKHRRISLGYQRGKSSLWLRSPDGSAIPTRRR